MDQKQAKRETYEAPAIRRIRLVEGELAAAGCKTSTAKMGPTGSGCFASMCLSIGS
jgi:hypothetical protein